MNETHEVCILIDDEKYVDQLVISLVRQGYSVCFTANSGGVTVTSKD